MQPGLLLFFTSLAFGQQRIDTIAGGFVPATLPGLTSVVDNPLTVAVDRDGNVYTVAHDSHLVLRLQTNGQRTVLAGTGVSGYTGDNGPASAATFYFPQEVAYDGADSLYIADTGNAAVRRINLRTGI